MSIETARFRPKKAAVFARLDNFTGRDLTFYNRTYDELGNLLSEKRDSKGYCIADDSLYYQYTYDEFGNAIVTDYDRDGDGTLDGRIERTFDERCNELTMTDDGVDLMEWGACAFSTTTYDEEGRLLEFACDSDGDATPDEFETYSYDENGKRLSFCRTLADDDECYELETYAYDDNDRLVAIENLSFGDEEYETAFTYDDQGRVITSTESQTYAMPSRHAYKYDSSGRLISIDDDSDTVVYVTQELFFYECSDDEMLACSADLAPPPVHYDAECIDPFEAGYPDSELGRDGDPVVLGGDDIDLLLDRNPDSLVGFRYDGTWEQIPVQVDERLIVDFATVYNHSYETCSDMFYLDPAFFSTLVYADANTNVGADTDSSFDADDEIVFMLKDASQKRPDGSQPEGVIAGSGVEVVLSDPDSDEIDELKYVYFFDSDGSIDNNSGGSYGEYFFSLDAGDYPDNYNFCQGPNPEDSWFRSAYYTRHFIDRWLEDGLEIHAPHASGENILYANNSDALGCGASAFNEAEGAFINNKSGPVRSIRSFVGAQSGVLTQQTHFFYERREDIVTELRVHALGDTSINAYLNYSSEAVGMKYYNCAIIQGVTIDGEPDEIWFNTASPSEIGDGQAWEMVSGSEGSLVNIYQFDIDFDCSVTGYYVDDVTSETAECANDEGYFGASGLTIEGVFPSTDIGGSNHFISKNVRYYLSPGTNVADARQLSKYVYHPLVVSVSAADES